MGVGVSRSSRQTAAPPASLGEDNLRRGCVLCLPETVITLISYQIYLISLRLASSITTTIIAEDSVGLHRRSWCYAGMAKRLRAAGGVLAASVLLGVFTQALASCPSPESIRPCQCTTRAEEIQIWCGGNELSAVLSGLAAVGAQTSRPIDELILENNVMTALPGRGFAPLRLVRLMLRDNRLERLAASWLAGLEPSLLEVFLVEQELRSLPEDSFQGLTKMEAVTLKAGLVQRLPEFSGLPKLRYLHTELPLLSELPSGRLSGLEALEQLHIVGSGLISSLPASALEDIPRLVLANFSDCGVSWIHPRSLMRLPSLKEIDLTNNKIVDAGQVGRSVRELPHLMVIKLSGNKIDVLRETTFVDIPPLAELHLDGNRILEVHRGAFHRLPSLVKLDLSNNQIRRILPEFFLQSYDSRLEEVLLMGNQLEHIASIAVILETLPRLRFLDASENRLEEIGFGALRGHPTLERLHLNGNRLKRVVREAFAGMPSLIELRLSNNSLSNYLEMPLWNLPNLKGLELSENELRRVDRRLLANLPSLRRLDLSRNNLLSVDPACFLGSSALEHVNLSRNALDQVPGAAFAHLAGLFELDLSWNKLGAMVPGLPRALEYLHLSNNKITALPRSPSPDLLLPALRLLNLNGNRLAQLRPEGLISMPLLQKLYLSENMLSKVEERLFDGLGRLEVLSLADNRISEVDRNAFRDLRRVEELDLKGNRLSRLDRGVFRENSRLRKLDLSRNTISDIPKGIFDNNKEVDEVYLSENSLTSFPSALMEMSGLKILDLGYNRIDQLLEPLAGLKSLYGLRLSGNRLHTLVEGTFAGLSNLTVLELDTNGIQYVSSHTIRSLPALTTLRMSRNKLSSIPSAAFSDLPSLTDVELQENELTQIASDSFSGTPNLLMLNLSHNHITSLERAGLHGVKSVEVLDLSYNRLTKLSAPSLPTLDSLIELKMDGNKICAIQGTPFNKMTHLRVLSLRNNRLMSLSETAFQPLRSTIYQLDIEGNPLKCSCSLLWLQSWVREGPGRGPRCSDGTLLKEREISPGDCVQPKSSDLLRQCEEFSAAVGPTQQLQSITSNWKDPNHKPTPEESDYFYADYIEYDENTTIPVNLTQYVQTTTTATIVISPSTPQTAIPPAVMSHFISGDTPTLYAKPGSGLMKDKPTNPPSTTFTFFGMPLPSLGKFFGSSRKADGGGSRFPSKGHIQPVRLPAPEGGFKPVLKQGGFRPIFNPYAANSSLPSASQLQTTRASFKPSSPSVMVISSSTARTPFPTPKFPVQYTESYEVETTRLPVLPVNGGHREEEREDERTDIVEENEQSHRFTYNNYTHQSIYEFNRLEPEVELSTPQLESHFPLPVPTPYTLPSTANPLIFQDSSEEGNDFVESTQEKDPVSTEEVSTTKVPVATGGGPAPLSAFLAPGGQLPPYRNAGRPTITKVVMSPPPSPVAEAAVSHTVAPRLEEPRASERQNTSKRADKHLDWYYSNYNRTNLQPYVGPGLGRSSAPFRTPTLWTFGLLLVIYRHA